MRRPGGPWQVAAMPPDASAVHLGIPGLTEQGECVADAAGPLLPLGRQLVDAVHRVGDRGLGAGLLVAADALLEGPGRCYGQGLPVSHCVPWPRPFHRGT